MKRCKTMFTVVFSLAVILSGALCYGQTQLVSDTFSSGANGTYLGPNWTGCGYNGGAYSKLVYENGQAGGAGYWSQDCALYTGYGPFPGDQYATATVVAPRPSTIIQAAVELRSNSVPSSAEAYIACGWNAHDFPADYHYRIWSLKPNDPGATSLYLSSVTPAANDVISCQVLGSTVSMKVNGQILATVNDISGLTSGYPGLYYIDPSGTGPTPTDVIFSNFTAGSGPALVSVTITPSSPTVTEGSFVQFTATALYADGSTATMSTWSSSNPTVASIDNTGFAFAGSPGNVTITAASGGDSGTTNMSVSAANGYTPLVHDSFNGPTGSYLGSNWTGCAYNGGSYSGLVYENNQAGGSGYWSQDCSLYTGYGVFPGDQYATATIVSANPTSSPQTSLQLRANATPSTAESYIACGWDAQDFAPDYHYRIWSLKPNDPGATSLFLSSVTPAPNDVIWCQVQGTTVTMNLNGTTLASVTDTSGNTTGYPGLYYVDPNGTSPTNSDVMFDNFVAGRIDTRTLTAIAVTPLSTTVTPGGTVSFTATGTYSDGTSGNVTTLVNWSSSNSSVATINTAGQASAASAGTVTITAASGSTSGTATLTVAATTPTVTFTGAPASSAYNSSFTVTATTNAPVMPTITGTTGVCSVGAVSGTPASATATVTMLTGTGTCTMTANWVATTNYTAAGPLTQTTAATEQGPTVSFTGAPATAVYNASFVVTATTNASTMPQITGTANVCTVSGVSGTPANSSATVVMITGTGTCTLNASWAADAHYPAATAPAQTTRASKANSTVAITGLAPNPSTRGQSVRISFSATGTGLGPTGSVRVTSSSGSSCTGTLSSSHTGSCSINFSASGTKVLTARYAGSTNFNASTSASATQTVR